MIRENWKSPMNRMRWRRALKERASSVVLRDGRKFRIRYIFNPFYSNGENEMDRQVAFVSPVRGIVPMGYFRLSLCTTKEWVLESDRADRQPGTYEKYLNQFLGMDVDGIQVDEQWPDLEGKDMGTVRRGFAHAKSMHSRTMDHINVIKFEGKIFLVKESKNVD